MKCYWYDELGYRVRDCLQFKNRTKATAAVVDDSDSDGYGDVLMVSDEVSSYFQQQILDSACFHYVCYSQYSVYLHNNMFIFLVHNLYDNHNNIKMHKLKLQTNLKPKS